MAAKPLTAEAIQLTEKKMDMTLDDIIKMSKNTAFNGKKQRRVPNKNHKFSNGFAQEKSIKLRRFMDSRSSMRQGLLAKRRSNFQGNQFPVATEVARKAAFAPLRNRVSNHKKVANWNGARVGVRLNQRRNAVGTLNAKQPMRPERRQQQQDIVPKTTKPQTLDSLFANMKEQRKMVFGRQNNYAHRNGSGQQIPPWGRAHIGN